VRLEGAHGQAWLPQCWVWCRHSLQVQVVEAVQMITESRLQSCLEQRLEHRSFLRACSLSTILARRMMSLLMASLRWRPSLMSFSSSLSLCSSGFSVIQKSVNNLGAGSTLETVVESSTRSITSGGGSWDEEQLCEEVDVTLSGISCLEVTAIESKTECQSFTAETYSDDALDDAELDILLILKSLLKKLWAHQSS